MKHSMKYPMIDHPWFELSKTNRWTILFRQDTDWELMELFLNACVVDPVKYSAYLHMIGLYIDSGEYSSTFNTPDQARLTRMLSTAVQLEQKYPEYQMVYHLLMFQGFRFPTNSKDLNLDIHEHSPTLIRELFDRMLRDKISIRKRGNGWTFQSVSIGDNNRVKLSIDSMLINTVAWLYGQDVAEHIKNLVNIHAELGTTQLKTSCVINHYPYQSWHTHPDILAFASPWLNMIDQVIASKISNAYSSLSLPLDVSN